VRSYLASASGPRLSRQPVGWRRTACSALPSMRVSTSCTSPGRATAVTGEVLGEVLGSRRRDVVLATGLCSRPSPDRMQRDSLGCGSCRRWRTACVGWARPHRRLLTCRVSTRAHPVEETLLALDDAVHQGKVRYHRLFRHGGLAGRQGARRLGAARAGRGSRRSTCPTRRSGAPSSADLVPMAMAERLALVAHPGRFTDGRGHGRVVATRPRRHLDPGGARLVARSRRGHRHDR